MNFGTPAFALNYEHKSEGIMNQLGLPSFGAPLSELLNGQLICKVKECISNIDEAREKVRAAVVAEKGRAKDMIKVVTQ